MVPMFGSRSETGLFPYCRASAVFGLNDLRLSDFLIRRSMSGAMEPAFMCGINVDRHGLPLGRDVIDQRIPDEFWNHHLANGASIAAMG
jgi:hypothetical protein